MLIDALISLRYYYYFIFYIMTEKAADSVYIDLPRVRLDGGARHFRRRWGYDNAVPTLLEDIEEDGDDISDTYSLREETYTPFTERECHLMSLFSYS